MNLLWFNMEGNCLGLWGLVVFVTLVLFLPVEVASHGRMIEPPMRSSMWRFGFNTPKNYDDNGLNCGGFENQHHFQDGKCGVCGDPWQGPRRNEPNGIYATGTITRQYRTGQKIPLVLDITSNHKGYFEFRICPWNNPRLAVNQSCLDEHPLVVEGSGIRYPLTLQGAFVMVNLTGQLPDNLTCTQCVLQWRWVGGQHMGIKDGRECMGCGKQEQWHNCADVAIGYDYPVFEMNKPGVIQQTVPPPTVATPSTLQPIVPGSQDVKTNEVKDFSRQSNGRLGAPAPVEITAEAYNNMNIGMPSRKKVSRFEPEKQPTVTLPPDKGPLITYLADTPPPPQPLIISSSDLFFQKPAEPDVGVRDAQVTAQQEDPNLSRGVSFTSLLEKNTDTHSSVPNSFGHVQANEGTSQFMKVSLQSLTGNPTKHVNSFTGKSFPSRFGSYPYRMYNSRDKTPSVLISSQSNPSRFFNKQPSPISTLSRTNQNSAIQKQVPVDLPRPIMRKEEPKLPSTEIPTTTYPTTTVSTTTMTTTTTIITTTTTSPTTTTTQISTTDLSTSTGTFFTSSTKGTTTTLTTVTTTKTERPKTTAETQPTTTEIPTTEIPPLTTTTTTTTTTQIPPAVPITQGYIIQDMPHISTFGSNFVPYVTTYYPTELYYITNDMTPNAPPGEYLATTPDPSLTLGLYAADVPTESQPQQQAHPTVNVPDGNASATTSSPKSDSGVKTNNNPRFVPSNTIVDPNQPWMTHQDYLASMSSQTSNVPYTFHPYQIAVVNDQVIVPPGMTQAQARAQAQAMLQVHVQKRLQAQVNAQTRAPAQIQTQGQSQPQRMMVNQQRMMAMQASAMNGGPANFNMMTHGPRSSTFNTQSGNINYPMWGQQVLPRELEGIPGPMCATGRSICRGKGVWANMQNFDRYCATQCMMGLCPFNLCVCTCPGEEFIRQDCRSWIDTNHMNRWCEQNCLGGFCPAEICYCNI
ncbi:mucin-5B-like [Haliotis asinina]|uniref:mucin-5B-like n=1 Tax=Haliotis asinina TaxID=109174 RepID=UPI0035327FB2